MQLGRITMEMSMENAQVDNAAALSLSTVALATTSAVLAAVLLVRQITQPNLPVRVVI